MEDGNTKTKTNNPTGQEGNNTLEAIDRPLSIVDEARAIRDEIRTEREKLERANSEAKTIAAEGLLGRTTGGNVEVKTVSPEDAKTAQAKEFFKGTALGDAIIKTNE